jgi:hypothetical protein
MPAHPQKLGFRIPRRCDSRHEPTLRYVAAQFALHRRYPRITLKLWSDKKNAIAAMRRLGSTLLVEVARLASRQEWFACLCWMLLDSSGQACAAEKVTPESRGAAFEDEGAIQDRAREDAGSSLEPMLLRGRYEMGRNQNTSRGAMTPHIHFLVACVAAHPPSCDCHETIKIGFLAPLTGPFAAMRFAEFGRPPSSPQTVSKWWRG